MNLEEFTKAKKMLAQFQMEKDRAEGSLATIKERLRKEFKCNTIKEAKQKLKELKEELEELRSEYNQQSEGLLERLGKKS